MVFKKLLAGACIFMILFGILGNELPVQAKETYAQMAERLDKMAYNKDDLGAVYTKDGTTFKVWAPTASAVSLNLFATGSDEEKGAKKLLDTAMEYNKQNGIWFITVPGDLANQYYTYSVTVDGKQNETGDIYAKAAGVNGERSMVVNLEKTNPKGWEKDAHVFLPNQTDAIVWEVHVKDFSNQPASGVREEYRGKYLAFTETNTTVNGEGKLPTCVDYLKKLGVNTVHINPFYDFGSVDESKTDDTAYNWGYDPKNYNVPEGSYSSNPYDGNVRINEAKQMIQALHNAGISVIMDVVYNHTYTEEDSFFHKTVPNYYHRFAEDGTWSNGSACGNDTASEHKMFGKYMVDSLKYWTEEYHVDGFRFDLMGLHDVDTMNEIRNTLDKIDKRIILYGEAWDLSTETTVPLATQKNMNLLSDRIAAFNDGMRDTIKGSNFEKADKGFVQGKFLRLGLEDGIKAATENWAASPSQTVTYTSCHDNRTLYDKLVDSVKDEGADYRKRDEQLVAMNKLAGAGVFTAQGMAFMLAGEEMARSKDGDHNSYMSSPALNQIDWTSLYTYGDLTAYYKGLIHIRKNFAPLRDATNTSIENTTFLDYANQKLVAFSMENKLTPDTQWKHLICIYNNDTENDVEFSLDQQNLPKDFVIIANEDRAGVTSLGEVKADKMTIKKTSVLILVDKESFDKTKLTADTGFEELLIKNMSTQQSETKPVKPTASKAAEERDTGKPLVPAIIAGVLAAGTLLSAILYRRKKHKDMDSHSAK